MWLRRRKRNFSLMFADNFVKVCSHCGGNGNVGSKECRCTSNWCQNTRRSVNELLATSPKTERLPIWHWEVNGIFEFPVAKCESTFIPNPAILIMKLKLVAFLNVTKYWKPQSLPAPPLLKKGIKCYSGDYLIHGFQAVTGISKSRNKDSVQLWIQPQEIHLVHI